MIIFGTGHRLKDIDNTDYTFLEMKGIALGYLSSQGDTTVICGMANGWDLAFGHAALDTGLAVWAARPWGGHVPVKGDEELYDQILDEAELIEDVYLGLKYPGPWVYDLRNKWMVNHASEGAAFWSGRPHGWTYNCLTYAKKIDKPVHNLYPGLEGLVEL